MNNMDRILESIKGKQPLIENEEQFFDKIIDELPEREKREKRPLQWEHVATRALQTLLSTAAVIIISLFIVTHRNTKSVYNGSQQPKRSIYSNIPQCCTLRNIYNNHKTEYGISYSQLKKMIYEKN